MMMEEVTLIFDLQYTCDLSSRDFVVVAAGSTRLPISDYCSRPYVDNVFCRTYLSDH